MSLLIERSCSRCTRKFSSDGGAICEPCKQYMKAWRASHPEQKKKDDKKRWIKHRERLIVEKIAWQRTEHGKRVRARLNKKSRDLLRSEMIVAYGGCCSCCGETTPEFLALDHLNGGGRQERKQRGGTIGILRRLKREGWPKDSYTVLCHNCNMAKAFYGECPHAKLRQIKAA